MTCIHAYNRVRKQCVIVIVIKTTTTTTTGEYALRIQRHSKSSPQWHRSLVGFIHVVAYSFEGMEVGGIGGSRQFSGMGGGTSDENRSIALCVRVRL